MPALWTFSRIVLAWMVLVCSALLSAQAQDMPRAGAYTFKLLDPLLLVESATPGRLRAILSVEGADDPGD
jgi:hypothetical protein